MPHHDSVFRQLLKHIPWAAFDRLVAAHGADEGIRRFDSRKHLVALLYGQLSGAGGLRATVCGLESQRTRLYHSGGKPVARSTMSDANARRPAGLLCDLFGTLLQQATRQTRRKLAETTYLIDSTPLPLDTRSADWSRFSHDVCGAKLHVIYDPQGDRPIYAALTAARVNDVTAAQTMPIEPGATYVFDLGYYDYGWWASLDAQGCRLVTRFKTNTPLTLVEELEVPAGGDILSDRIGFLPVRQARNRRNPMGEPVREVRVRIEENRELRLLTNDLDASAQEIADLYKRRWRIELFFRWLKQNLRIRKFVGVSENAVRLQIAAALIAYLLLRLAQATQTRVKSPLAFVRLVRDNLMRRRSIADLLRPDDPPPPTSSQLAIQWS